MFFQRRPLAVEPQFTLLERIVIGVSKGFIAVVAVAAVWAFLTLYFFACCGVGASSYLDPAVSPLGYWPTIIPVWPAMGVLCILGEGIVDGLRLIVRRIRGFAGKRNA